VSVVRFDRYAKERGTGAFDRKRDDHYDEYLQDEQEYDRDHLTRVVQMFEQSEDSTRKAREKAERDVDYYDGKQLTKKEYDTLVKRGQVPHVDNRVKRKIRYMEGLEQQQRTDPRALPRTPQHEEDANSVTDCLRYVTEENNFDQLRSRVWKDLLCWGWSGYEIVHEENPGQPNAKVIIRRCQADRMFWDPFSEAEDFDDARYRGLCVWGDRDEFVKRYGKKAGKVFDETIGEGEIGGTYDDKPRYTTWTSREDKRVRARIVQVYYRTSSGLWHFCEFTKGGFLAGGVSPWVDENKVPEHPFAWGSANVDRDNNRYGEIRDMIDPQDAINKRHSKFLHLMSVRQTFGNEIAMGSMTTRELREQAARPDGHFALGSNVEFNKHFGIVPTADMAQGQFQLLQQAIAEMDLQGPNAAMQGKDPRQFSGRAIQLQQQGGALESNPTFDTLRHMDNEAYKKIWRRIRASWTAQDYIRVTDDERNVKWVGINMPKMDRMLGPDGNPVINPQTGQPVVGPKMDPQTGQPVMQNQLSEIDVDIIMDEAPHVGTLQQEEFMALVEMASKGLPIPPKAIIKASQLRSKFDILKDMEAAAKNPPPNPIMMKVQADMQAKQADAQLKAQSAQQKAQLDAQSEQRAAGMDAQRMQMEQEKAQVEAATAQQEAEAKLALLQREADLKMQLQLAEHQQQMQMAREKLALEREKADLAAQVAMRKAQTDESIAMRQAETSEEIARTGAETQTELLREKTQAGIESSRQVNEAKAKQISKGPPKPKE